MLANYEHYQHIATRPQVVQHVQLLPWLMPTWKYHFSLLIFCFLISLFLFSNFYFRAIQESDAYICKTCRHPLLEHERANAQVMLLEMENSTSYVFIILHGAILFDVLHYIILYYIVKYNAVIYYTISYCNKLTYKILCYTIIVKNTMPCHIILILIYTLLNTILITYYMLCCTALIHAYLSNRSAAQALQRFW